MTDYRDPNNIDPNGNYTITQLIKFIREKMFGIDVRESIAKALEKVYEDASKDGNANMEVSEARGAFALLKDRLNDSDRELSNKADKTYVDAVLSSISAGGPRELFYSLSALESKYPSGAEGTYLVFDAIHTDGAHSYMWKDNAWNDLGVYQGLGIPDGSIDGIKLAKRAIDYSKTIFLKHDSTKNLFDGVYVKGMRVAGNTGSLSLLSSDNGNVAILPVKANTTYYFYREQSDVLNFATATKLLQIGESFDGDVNRNMSTTANGIDFKFDLTTGSNDKYLYIYVSSLGDEPFLLGKETVIGSIIDKIYPVEPDKIDLLSKTDFDNAKYDADKMTYMELNPNRNHFNGEYTKGLSITGNTGTLELSTNVNGVVAIIPIETNKTYWLARSASGLLNFATATRILNVGESFDGAVNRNMSNTSTIGEYAETTLTTGTNDKYLYVYVSNTNEEPELKVTQNLAANLEPVNYNVDVYKFKDSVYLPADENDIRKIEYNYSGSNRLDIYIPSHKSDRWVHYVYQLVDDTNINMHQWRVTETNVLGKDKSLLYALGSNSEWEGAILEVEQADYMGGFHGDERNVSLDIIIDGTELVLNQSETGTASEIKIVNQSLLNRVSDTETDLMRRFKISTWTTKQYTVENKFIALESFEISESKCTMASINYLNDGKSIITNGRMNDNYEIMNLNMSVSGKQRIGSEVSEIEMFGDEFYISVASISDKYPNAEQYIQSFNQYGYVKAYFDTTGEYTINQNETLNIKSVYKIWV